MAPVEDKLKETCIRCYDHRRPMNVPVQRGDLLRVEGVKRARGRPKIMWLDVVRKDMIPKYLSEDRGIDKVECQKGFM